MSEPARRRATYEDLVALPPNVIGEILYGSLVTQPRPAGPHTSIASNLGGVLIGPFRRGIDGPGGWTILHEPELHIGGHVLVPDLAGWRRETLPEITDAAYFTVAPDWVCEVLSPSTEDRDREEKLPLYGAFGVEWAWLVDPPAQRIEVYRSSRGRWSGLGTYAGPETARLEPFDAIELPIDFLFSR